jgi:trans-aconitate methyltransferase
VKQTWSASNYACHGGFVPQLGAPLLELLAPQPGESVLDLGCGDGVLSEEIARAGAQVIGVDSSTELVAAARARGLTVHLADAQALDLDLNVDAVFSNAALHWMPNADAVLSGVKRILKKGGRFVGELGGHGNIAAIVTAMLAALDARGIDGLERWCWYFPSPADYQARLERHGFRVESITLFARPTPLPTGLVGWLATFANPFIAGRDANQRDEIFAHVERLTAPSLRDEKGNWHADYVRLRFHAVSSP